MLSSDVSAVLCSSHLGSMVCQRGVDPLSGRIRQGAVIPRDATEAYLEAAGRGLEATVTNNAPALHDGSAVDANRLDLLLVDGVNAPAAVFRCERPAGAADWSERDLYVVRNLAQTLAVTLRRTCNSHQPPQRDAAAAQRRPLLPPLGMQIGRASGRARGGQDV